MLRFVESRRGPVVLALLIALAVLFASANALARKPPKVEPEVVQAPVDVPTEGRARFGAADAAVTIAMFADFQCPFSKRALETVQKIADAYAQQVVVVYFHLPLDFHAQAEPAARAAWAAAQQGQFLTYAIGVFTHQKDLNDSKLVDIARAVGLNLDQWQSDRTSQAASEAVAADVALAGSLGVNATPSFFINGVAFNGAKPYDEFEAEVLRALEKK